MSGMTDKDDDMIGLPHPVSRRHPPMARIKRAAQFAAFDALAGFGAAIAEAGRETVEKPEISDDMADAINAALNTIAWHSQEEMFATITYFLPDRKKSGGRYVTVYGKVKKIDTAKRVIIMADGTRITVDDILEIDLT